MFPSLVSNRLSLEFGPSETGSQSGIENAVHTVLEIHRCLGFSDFTANAYENTNSRKPADSFNGYFDEISKFASFMDENSGKRVSVKLNRQPEWVKPGTVCGEIIGK